MNAITLDKPGTAMPDGTIYAGISPHTGKLMYVAKKDAPLTFSFEQAAKYAAELDAHGHKDWRVPSRAELNVLLGLVRRGSIGNFNLSGSDAAAGWYWSSSKIDNMYSWAQRFSRGSLGNFTGRHGDERFALRCVRG